ncbi:MAG: carotenoid 1,2-hydratase [Pseudomonadota bacterium]
MGVTVIAFIGSVFSPYYAHARRRRALADPEQYVSINAVLYLPGGKRWAMTERGRTSLGRDQQSLRVGPSAMSWDGDRLAIDVEEVTVPIPRKLKGRILLYPEQLNTQSFSIDGVGVHRWQPISPRCRVEVDFDAPELSWQGCGYLDSNRGDEPLEKAFRQWWWSRTHLAEGTLINYETEDREGAKHCLSILAPKDPNLGFQEQPAGRATSLPRTGWRVARPIRSSGGDIRVLRTLEDTPFYSRSVVSVEGAEGDQRGVHESLDLNRFRSPIVQAMLPFRMPRLAPWAAFSMP